MLGITQSEQLNSEFKKLLTQHYQSMPPILLVIHMKIYNGYLKLLSMLSSQIFLGACHSSATAEHPMSLARSSGVSPSEFLGKVFPV